MEKILEKHKLPQLTQFEMDHGNSPITIMDIELIILKIPKKELSSPDGFMENSTKHLKKNFTQSRPENRRGGDTSKFIL